MTLSIKGKLGPFGHGSCKMEGCWHDENINAAGTASMIFWDSDLGHSVHHACMHYEYFYMLAPAPCMHNVLTSAAGQRVGCLTSVPVSSWILKSRGGSGTDVASQEAPHTLFIVSHPVLGPLICTSFTEPRMAASCTHCRYICHQRTLHTCMHERII